MKRIPALQPLSREHHSALSLAKACERAAQSRDEELVGMTCQRALKAFSDEMEMHFLTEEQSWLPLLRGAENQSLEQRTIDDHRQLRALLDAMRQNDAEALNCFGKLLMTHVRFEERELFPVLEKLMQ